MPAYAHTKFMYVGEDSLSGISARKETAVACLLQERLCRIFISLFRLIFAHLRVKFKYSY